jgi:carboxypeptidase C (cathepsin A)
VFNDYVRKDLKFGEGRVYKSEIDTGHWNLEHKQPGMGSPYPGIANVMPDLATAMKYNPQLKVLLNAGYYDLATPFFQGIYEMQHLPMSQDLQKNIEYQQYESGHMVYAHETSLKAIHDNTAAFIVNSSNVKK